MKKSKFLNECDEYTYMCNVRMYRNVKRKKKTIYILYSGPGYVFGSKRFLFGTFPHGKFVQLSVFLHRM